MRIARRHENPSFARRSAAVSLACAAAILLAFLPVQARAQCSNCFCDDIEEQQTRTVILQQHIQTRQHIYDEFEKNQNWLVNDFFKDSFAPAILLMTEQLATSGMNQMMALGAMLDAKTQLETQRLMAVKTAEAHRDYQTSTDICVWGTAVNHMASADSRAALTKQVLAKRSIDRQLGMADGMSMDSPNEEATARLERVRTLYCNPDDNNRQMQYLCGPGAPPRERRNRDIDYGRVMNDKLSLDVNFTNAALTDDEQDLFALESYLYVNKPFARITKLDMGTTAGRERWMDMRAVVAKHSVAENSFANIVAMKAASDDTASAVQPYLAAIFERMGISQEDARNMVGANPSYYAMLHAISQAIYQSPSFYASLYDTPVNVRRKDVAMQAINLMLGRDTYLSELREESLLAEILEMEVVKAQEKLVNVYGALGRGEKKNN